MTEAPHVESAPAADIRSDAARTAPRISRLTMVVIVGCFVVAGHIWSINTGLYLDDHSHFAHLRWDDWSFTSAIDAARLGIVGEVLDLWGRREAGLRFFRPIAFWTMKAEYTLAGWNPLVMHLFSLGWHFACSLLVGAVAMRCFGNRVWATVAAALTAIHPAHMATVYWIACQTELITTMLLLAGVLAYARYAGWPQRLFLRDANDDPPRAGSVLWMVPVLVCYALALGCRENAVLFPAICWAGDWLFKAKRKAWIRWDHMAMGAVLAGYFALRWHMLGGFPLPAKPYMIPITDPGFPQYALQKISIYLMGLFSYVPVVPIGGRVYFSARPSTLYGSLGVAIGLMLLAWFLYRRRKALLWPVLWILLFIAPVMPVFASSHHLYLPGVGAVLILTALLAAMGGVTLPAGQKLPRSQTVTCGIVLLLHAVGLGALTWCLGFAYTRGTLVEDIVVEDVLQRGRPLREGDHLYFANLSPLAYYVVPAIKNELGLRELHGHILTPSTSLVRMQEPGQLRIRDPHTLRVWAPPDDPYFASVAGRSFLDMMGMAGLPDEGETIEAQGYRVTVADRDGRGIHELVFTFDQPLDAADCHVFFGSPQFMAYPIDVHRHISPPATHPASSDTGENSSG